MESWKEELYHHGIDGQKWGVRNGPPYPLSGSTSTRMAKAAKITDKARTITNESRNLATTAKSSYQKKSTKRDLSDKTNKELQDYITRANLERQYNSLKDYEVDKGSNKVLNILTTAVPVTSALASIASIGYVLTHGDMLDYEFI